MAHFQVPSKKCRLRTINVPQKNVAVKRLKCKVISKFIGCLSLIFIAIFMRENDAVIDRRSRKGLFFGGSRDAGPNDETMLRK